ncbi:phosphohydrolase [Acetobacter ascendens]|uniref:phosphohydrolase n=1 Tax=Acetobacter ascendens TaxID=481146 RepID=UPI000875AAA7|nr:phosphohydrolase [Acetobacter ascendens]AOW50036.1 phosphohydrolase [Acetobacter ascendens]
MIHSFGGPWPALPLSASFRIDVEPPPPAAPADIEQEITHLWQQACVTTPALFNGCVFSASCVTRTAIKGYWTEYRRVFAQMKNPALFPFLRLQPLAVVGLVHTPDGYILGRRNPSSIYQGNFWQSPPAGSIEKRTDTQSVNLAEQILAEATEELGLDAKSLQVGQPLMAVRHPHTRVLDIGLVLETALTFKKVEKSWKQHANKEYDMLACVSAQDVTTWLGQNAILPTSQYLLQHDVKSKMPRTL